MWVSCFGFVSSQLPFVHSHVLAFFLKKPSSFLTLLYSIFKHLSMIQHHTARLRTPILRLTLRKYGNRVQRHAAKHHDDVWKVDSEKSLLTNPQISTDLRIFGFPQELSNLHTDKFSILLYFVDTTYICSVFAKFTKTSAYFGVSPLSQKISRTTLIFREPFWKSSLILFNLRAVWIFLTPPRILDTQGV